MKTPHFYNFKTRMGLRNSPWKSSVSAAGVEEGGTSILTQEFLDMFHGPSVDSYSFPEPVSGLADDGYFQTIATCSIQASELMTSTLKDGEIPVMVGGDHSASLPAFMAHFKRLDPRSCLILRVDSHPDLLQSRQSTTGNFHGMWMRPFFDEFDRIEIATIVRPFLSGEQVIYVGNLDREEGETMCMGRHSIDSYSLDQLSDGLETWRRLVVKYDHIIVDIDIDAFDRTIAPATGIPAAHGLFTDHVEPFLDEAGEKLAGLHLVEVNPRLDPDRKTASLAQLLIRIALA